MHHLHNKQCHALGGLIKYLQKYSFWGGREQTPPVWFDFRLTWWQRLSRAWGT